MRIILNREQREVVKTVLASVLDDADLKAQFDKASHTHRTTPNDSLSGDCGQYAGLLKEIIDERAAAAKKPRPPSTPGPDLETLKKKYGPKN